MGRQAKLDTARRIAIAVLTAAGLIGFGKLVNKYHRIADWLTIRYAGYWLLTILFAAACFASGHVIVKRTLRGRVLPLYEHVAVSFAAGVYAFFLGMFLGGILRAYGGIFFFALPLALVAAGARPAYRYLRRARRGLGRARRRAAPAPWWSFFVHAFGALGVLLVYFAILSPNNAAFDSRWQHLGIAEHYAAEGAVRKFQEGWFIGAQPHLASFLYTWAYLLPKSLMFDRVELAAHVELIIFLVALIGIPALVRRMLRRAGRPGGDPQAPPATSNAHRFAWAVRFLFPGVFLYDSSLCLGADHVASVFAIPIYLLILRAWPDLSARVCVLLTLVMTGAVLTKYTGALILVAPALLVVPVRAVQLAVRAIRKRDQAPPLRAVWAGPLAALVSGIVFFAPHWLKNLIWYGDPIYPVLHARFRPRPWTVDSAARFEKFMSELWRPERSLKGVGQTFGSLATFSFVPNDWEKFHGHAPVFGSLFTFSVAMMLFLKGTKRLWGLFGATHLGILIWFWTHHQDRYLQAALPLMTAATASVFALLFRQGALVRVLAGAVIALQIVWGSDVYFIPAHIYLGVPAKASIDMLSHMPGQPQKDRLVFSDPLSGVGKSMPKGAKPLLHDWHTHAGLGLATVADCPFHQGGISYVRNPSPLEVYNLLTGFGVTHVIDRPGQPREPDTLAGETVFHNFVYRTMGTPKNVEGWLVSPMAKSPPPPGNAPDPVLVHSCGRGLKPGLYHLKDLVVPAVEKGARDPRPFKAAAADPTPLLAEARAIAVESSCNTLPKVAETTFVRVAQRDPYAIWVRR